MVASSKHLPVRIVSLVALAGVGLVGSGAAPRAGKVRTYYIAADQVAWDYVPGGRNDISGTPFQDTAFFRDAPPRPISTVYQKVVYREYTDSTFRTLKPRPAAWEHLGFLGPLIRGEVGDTIRVLFKNNADRPYSVHAHGVFYTKDSEGAPYDDGTAGRDQSGDRVAPGGAHVYVWPVPERAGPGPDEGSSVMWMYHSHVDETRDINSGLLGVMIITARGKARPDGSPVDVDREVVAEFAQVHEEDSWLAEKNLPPDLGKSVPVPNPSQRQNLYPYFVTFSINGFTHGALPLRSFTFKKGERVRWYLMASTNDFDAHTPHWHGNTVLMHGMRTDVTSLLPMEMVVADMRPDNPGTWLFHCHLSFHNAAGMAARYAVVQ